MTEQKDNQVRRIINGLYLAHNAFENGDRQLGMELTCGSLEALVNEYSGSKDYTSVHYQR